MVEFSEDVVLALCGQLALGNGLRKIEKMEGMPSKAAVFQWLMQGEAYKATGETNHPKALFLDQYARAREVQADCYAEEIIEISDESTYDTYKEDGKTVVNMEHIQRDRLRVDSRKWLAGKLRPKKYGEKQTLEHTGENGGPLDITVTFGK